MSKRVINPGMVKDVMYGLPVMIRHDYQDERDKFIEQFVEQSIQKAMEYFNRGGVTIDVGCAYGYAVKRFEDMGYKAIGIDKYVDGYRMSENIIHDDFYRISCILESESCDNVFINHTLEHAENAIALVYQIFKIMKMGGIVFVAVPDGNYEWAWDLRDSTTHFSCFTPKFLESLFARYGFETLYLDNVELEPKRDNERVEIWYVGRKVKTIEEASMDFMEVMKNGAKD